jgi:hypothetical protein
MSSLSGRRQRLLYIPRYALRQLVRLASVYVFPDEPPSHVLARVELVRLDPNDFRAPNYVVRVFAGAHAGEEHETPEMALAPLGGESAPGH